jgi:hypothetical protein
MSEGDYVVKIRNLVLNINSNLGSSTYSTNKLLDEATNWEIEDRKLGEKQLLFNLIDRGREYIQLKRLASRHFLSKDLSKNYFTLYKWFKSLQILLDTFNVPLYRFSFDDLSLKD